MTRFTIDYTPAIQQHAGIGRYTDELTRALVTLKPNEEWHLFYVDPAGRCPAPPLDRLTHTSLPQSNKRWRLSVLLNTYAHRALDQKIQSNRGVFHATDHLLPPLKQTCSVFTLHDLTVLKFPTTHTQLNRRFLQLMLPRFLHATQQVIAVSEATRRDALERYQLAPERVRVIYHGVNACFQATPLAIRQKAQAHYQLPEKFIFTVGTIEPRKNLITLLEAYRSLQESDVTLGLVIAGKRGWHSESFFDRLRALNLQDKVKLLGYVPDEDLPALYSLATVFAYPSLYEGFGLPVLEAMACGTPVICSNTSSLPEIVGEAALQIQPTDVPGWARALEEISGNADLRARLSESGLKQAKRFTWEKTARQTYDLYQEVYAAHRP